MSDREQETTAEAVVRKEVVEGVVYDPISDSCRMGIDKGDGDFMVWIEDLLSDGDRVRVTIEVLG